MGARWALRRHLNALGWPLMAWTDAKTVAERWVRERLPADLSGKRLELVNFDSDDDARFFFPDRTAEFQRMVNSAIARQARKRKARTNYVVVTPAEYLEICSKDGIQDTPEERLAFIEACHRVL